MALILTLGLTLGGCAQAAAAARWLFGDPDKPEVHAPVDDAIGFLGSFPGIGTAAAGLLGAARLLWHEVGHHKRKKAARKVKEAVPPAA